MNRIRRLLAQLLLPSAQYDALTDTFMVPVSAELLGALGEWSQPVQIKVEHGPRWPGVASDFQMIVRTAAPMTRLDEGSGFWIRAHRVEGDD